MWTWLAKTSIELVSFLAVLHALVYAFDIEGLTLTSMLLVFALTKLISVIVESFMKGKKT